MTGATLPDPDDLPSRLTLLPLSAIPDSMAALPLPPTLPGSIEAFVEDVSANPTAWFEYCSYGASFAVCSALSSVDSRLFPPGGASRLW
jgi:hypothetical protein